MYTPKALLCISAFKIFQGQVIEDNWNRTQYQQDTYKVMTKFSQVQAMQLGTKFHLTHKDCQKQDESWLGQY